MEMDEISSSPINTDCSNIGLIEEEDCQNDEFVQKQLKSVQDSNSQCVGKVCVTDTEILLMPDQIWRAQPITCSNILLMMVVCVFLFICVFYGVYYLLNYFTSQTIDDFTAETLKNLE